MEERSLGWFVSSEGNFARSPDVEMVADASDLLKPTGKSCPWIIYSHCTVSRSVRTTMEDR